ncbi:hypothetical protein Tco_0098575 [Tanacetum coccineum]
MMARKRSRPQPVDEDDEEIKISLVIAPDEDKEVDYEILDRKYPIVESNGQRRYFSTLMGVLLVFDREDLNAIYQLVMNKYSNDIPEGFDRILWGDLMIMYNQSNANEFKFEQKFQMFFKTCHKKLHNYIRGTYSKELKLD